MKAQYKIAIGLVPFVTTAALASFSVYPALIEQHCKQAELEQRNGNNRQLLQKLSERSQAEAEQQSLENEIRNLRGAVPKQPELDLMMLDLERMCSESGADLISVDEPEKKQQSRTSENEVKNMMSDITQGKLTIGSKTIAQRQTASDAGKTKPPDTPLKKLLKHVFVTGNYDELLGLMKKLEAYQRVIGINDIELALPVEESDLVKTSASEMAKKIQPSNQHSATQSTAHQLPVMSFLMTLYYLP